MVWIEGKGEMEGMEGDRNLDERGRTFFAGDMKINGLR